MEEEDIISNMYKHLNYRHILMVVIGIIIIILILFIGIVNKVNNDKKIKIAKEIQDKESIEKQKQQEEEIMRFVLDNKKKEEEEATGIIYLTFDDGPSQDSTPQILEILARNNVKATFFVIHYNEANETLVKKEHSQGHKVALHGYSHTYSEIYTSLDACMENFKKIQEQVYNSIGEKSNIIRFPGGSSNTVSRKYCQGVMTELTQKVVEEGFRYFDWNVDSDDAGKAKNSEDIYNNVTSKLKPRKSKCSFNARLCWKP